MKFIQKNSTFSLRNRYIPALLLIAIFTSFAYVNVQQIIYSIEKDAKVINTSGRQRMLSQNLILLGLKYLDNPNKENRSTLEKNINLMKTTHEDLVTNHNSDKLDKIYTEKKLSVLLDDFLIKFNIYLKEPTEEKITKLANDAQILLPLLSEAVKEYENINTLKVHHLEQKQLIILIITIILLFLEIIFVFYPASRQIKNYTEQLEIFNTDLEKKVKEEIKKNKDKEKHLIQQSKQAQMGEMIDMIAHQWRQPLGAINSLNSTIEVQATLDSLEKEQTIKYTNKISSLIQYLSKTIDDFREFFKENKEKESFNCDALLESTIIITENSLKIHNINLIKDLNCTCNFKTYTSELKQVILNLIKNAEDALVDNNIKNPYIKISTLTKNGEYTLEVSDNAGGITKENINQIFDPHFSTKTKKNGTGLGLYMSKTIIEEHCEGSLSVSNNKDGAVFKITLPIS